MGPTTTTATPLLYTPEDAASLLGVGRTTVYALMGSGDLESVKIGRARRVPRGSLEDLVARLRAA